MFVVTDAGVAYLTSFQGEEGSYCSVTYLLVSPSQTYLPIIVYLCCYYYHYYYGDDNMIAILYLLLAYTKVRAFTL